MITVNTTVTVNYLHHYKYLRFISLNTVYLCIKFKAPISGVSSKTKRATLDDILNLLSTGFIKTGTGFLKSGSSESAKGNTGSEVRVGVAQV